MKKILRILAVSFLATIIGFSLISCNSQKGNEQKKDNGKDDVQEQVSFGLADTTEVARYFINEKIHLGWNLGNTLDAINWSNPSASTEDSFNPGNTAKQVVITGIKTLGVDIIRIPVTWTGFTGPAPNYTINPARLARVKEIVDWANAAGLKAIINIHHDGVNLPYAGSREFGWLKTGFHNTDVNRGDNPVGTINDAYKTEMYDRYKKVWTQIANYFKDYDEWLIFQSMNEVHNGNWEGLPIAHFTIMNELNQLFSDTVRATGGKNATRFLMFPGLAAKPSATLSNNFKLPEDSAGPGRQIVTFHYYDPFDFAHDAKAGSSWTGTDAQKRAIDNQFKPFFNKFTSQGIPVIIGEMGPRVNGNTSGERAQYRLNYIEYVYSKAYELGMIPVYWDDGGNFRMLNRSDGKPETQHAADSFAAMRKAVGK